MSNQDPTKRAQAEVLFAKLKHAHEVLSDPHKRAIYDCLGEEGLKEQGWEVVQRTRTPQEIRAEYESLARLREERRMQQRTNPTSKLTMTVNATDLFQERSGTSLLISPGLNANGDVQQERDHESR